MTGSPVRDVELRAGTVVRHEATHLSPNYTIAREMTVREATGNTIRVRDTVRYLGSTAGCHHPRLASNCEHEAITTWVLARPACDARCDASYDGSWAYASGDPAPAVDATCTCP